MDKGIRLFINVVIVVTLVGLGTFIYRTYSGTMIEYIFGEQKIVVFVKDVPVNVAVADTPEARSRGLSNVDRLPDNEGMLFVFDTVGDHRFWMKDTLIPLDIIWIDENMTIVHIEQNIRPESYPATFGSPVPSRFVLETNAFFTNTFNVAVGDKITIPAHRLPESLR